MCVIIIVNIRSGNKMKGYALKVAIVQGMTQYETKVQCIHDNLREKVEGAEASVKVIGYHIIKIQVYT